MVMSQHVRFWIWAIARVAQGPMLMGLFYLAAYRPGEGGEMAYMAYTLLLFGVYSLGEREDMASGFPDRAKTVREVSVVALVAGGFVALMLAPTSSAWTDASFFLFAVSVAITARVLIAARLKAELDSLWQSRPLSYSAALDVARPLVMRCSFAYFTPTVLLGAALLILTVGPATWIPAGFALLAAGLVDGPAVTVPQWWSRTLAERVSHP